MCDGITTYMVVVLCMICMLYILYMFHSMYVMRLSSPTNYHTCTFSANRFKRNDR